MHFIGSLGVKNVTELNVLINAVEVAYDVLQDDVESMDDILALAAVRERLSVPLTYLGIKNNTELGILQHAVEVAYNMLQDDTEGMEDVLALAAVRERLSVIQFIKNINGGII